VLSFPDKSLTKTPVDRVSRFVAVVILTFDKKRQFWSGPNMGNKHTYCLMLNKVDCLILSDIMGDVQSPQGRVELL
jgi:hypothetical protein